MCARRAVRWFTDGIDGLLRELYTDAFMDELGSMGHFGGVVQL
jgi:hypothetical protein